MRVFVADDHPLYRKGLAEAFGRADGLELMGVAENGTTALEAILRDPPDIVVLDVRMPDMTGLEVLAKMREAGVETPVIFLTGSEQQSVIYNAMRGGAKGYLLKTVDWDDLIATIRKVHSGETYIAPEVVGLLAGHIESQAVEIPRLTPRELEVLELLAQGLNQAEIATKLSVEFTTVRSHLRNLYRKLGVKGQAQAVAEGMRHRLIV